MLFAQETEVRRGALASEEAVCRPLVVRVLVLRGTTAGDPGQAKPDAPPLPAAPLVLVLVARGPLAWGGPVRLRVSPVPRGLLLAIKVVLRLPDRCGPPLRVLGAAGILAVLMVPVVIGQGLPAPLLAIGPRPRLLAGSGLLRMRLRLRPGPGALPIALPASLLCFRLSRATPFTFAILLADLLGVLGAVFRLLRLLSFALLSKCLGVRLPPLPPVLGVLALPPAVRLRLAPMGFFRI
ncbi:MAG TPA: hypothetical protein VGC45_14985 [Gryllotalpicola sp.]